MSLAREPRSLRLLHVEDSEVDHEIALAHLRRGGRAVQTLRVDSEPAFRAALEDDWDAVLADYYLPGFSGLEALRIVQEKGLLLPLVILSGAIGEEVAVQAMREGASDYLLKQDLTRLPMALDRAIDATEARRARLAADREVAASRLQLQELAQHLQTSIEQERAAIAREIHDDVGGALTALQFDIAWLVRNAADDAVRQRAQAALETAAHAIEASQRVMHHLRPAMLEQGLVPALQWLGHKFTARTGIECTFRASHEQLELPVGVPLVAYRATQEALTNATKHAQATRLSIDLALVRGVLSVEIADNGCGLAPDDLAKARSFGLRGLRERAGTVGGWVDVSSQPGQGTTVILSVPVSGDARRRALRGDEEMPAWEDSRA